MTRSARIGLAVVLLLGGVTFAMAQYGSYPPGTKKIRTLTANMATRATTLAAMRHTAHIFVDRPIMFWAIPSHTTATRVGAAGVASQLRLAH
jgi:hypothetical protein